MKQVVLVLCLLLMSFSGFALQDSVQNMDTTAKVIYKPSIIIDSAALARKNFVKDSLTWQFLNPNPNRPNPYVEKLLKDNLTTDPYLLSLPKNFKIVKNSYGVGNHLNKYPQWFLFAVLVLLTMFGVVRLVFAKEIANLFRAFFDNRILSQIDKEDNVLITWQFVFLYLIFSFTVGLFICLLLYKTAASDVATDFNSFLIISFAAFVFFGLKIFAIKFIGFLFEIQKLTRSYLNILYLGYINSLFLLLPAIFILTFIGANHGNIVIWAFILLFTVLIGAQLLRLLFKILLNHQLSKFYLFLYLCTLEICPILLFVKTINISL
ncbi:DUF4271 domain-containing protein [Pedobacter arcticus]|uniref:DUF4271 domain-containing protein n=1 Tax=Pedobacter arcticus TaxID=752140 RepID=UPI0002DFDF7D|nr:DUF4271 domain-containing protein [Pedobacter arcticus]